MSIFRGNCTNSSLEDILENHPKFDEFTLGVCSLWLGVRLSMTAHCNGRMAAEDLQYIHTYR